MNAPLLQRRTGYVHLAMRLVAEGCGEAESGGDPAATLAALRKRPAEGEERLAALADRFGLTDGELLAAALCLAAETDPLAARRIASAQAPVGGSRPLAGFAATLFERFGLDCIALAAGAAAKAGIFYLGTEDAPLPERSLHMAAPMVAALSGRRLEPEGILPLMPEPTDLPPSLQAEARRRAAELSGALAIRTPSPREGEALAERIAAELGLRCVLMGEERTARHAGWLVADGAIPMFRASLGPGERFRLDPPGLFEGPVIVVASPEGLIDASVPLGEWRVPIPDEAERSALWSRGGLDRRTAARAARTYRHGAGRIAEIGERLSGACGEDAWARLTEAVGAGARELDHLARRSPARVERGDLVVPDALAGGLNLLLDRIRFRHRLGERLGPSLRTRYRPGVRALFTGESGTGKTMAAHWIARQSGLPLYRVDLAAMTSKWIGETEKNLSTVLDAAQHSDVVLFFDEADSLFGARTEVGDSHDRFANAQTNYLLQRIEEYDGVAILATNSRDRFDPAFVRRLDSILEFPLPDAAARRALWRAHLGEAHSMSDGELDRLSLAVDLAGGHIRNIVLSAAVRAGRDSRAVAIGDILAAAAEEYSKLGRSPPQLASW